jgi:hypothetical protein
MRSASITMTRRWGALLVGMVVVVAAVATGFTFGGRQAAPPPSFAAPTRPPQPAVMTYYEVLDADGALLYERALDGVSLPRLIVERPSPDFSRTYTVDPAGRLALAGVTTGATTTLEAIDIATGASLWVTETPVLEPESGVWSADGRRWAALVAEVEFDAGPAVLIADIASGGTAVIALEERAWPQGFTTRGGLVLTERADDLQAPLLWRFLTVDPATGSVVRLASPPPVGPHSSYADDVAPVPGLGVAQFPLDDQLFGTTIQVRDLAGGQWRPLAEFETVDRVLFAPGGDAVTATADGKVVLVDLSGVVTELWDGPDYADLVWSASGAYLGISGWDERPMIAVVERATARVVELPLPEAIAEARVVGVTGSARLPGIALPPGGDPAPEPSPEPTGPPVAGAPAVVSGWLERLDGIPIAHAEIRVPTEDGGVRSAATMPPIALEDLRDQEVTISVAPRPGGPDILIKLDSDEMTQAWLWDPSSGRRPFPFPEGWPPAVADIAWRPDGGALASLAFPGGDDPVNGPVDRAVVVVAELDTRTVRQLQMPDGYSVLDGWWSQDELRLGREECFEECPGRYAYAALLRVSDGRLQPFGPRDRPATPIHLPTVEFDPAPEITLSSINGEAADDVRIRWPADLPVIDGGILLWGGPQPELLVGAPREGEVDLYRIEDPIGRARGGRLANPAPTLVATLPIAAESPQLSPDGGWLTVSDRTGTVRLVELDTNRHWSLGFGRDVGMSWLVGP